MGKEKQKSKYRTQEEGLIIHRFRTERKEVSLVVIVESTDGY